MSRRPLRPSPARAAALAGAAIATLSSVGCGADSGETAGGGLPELPAPQPVAAAATSPADFVGSEACAGCHEDQYDAWSASTHGRAGGPPGPGVVVAPFDGRPIRFADATVTPRVRTGVYEFVVRQDGFDEVSFQVDGVIGGAHMIGGGTQGFLDRQPDGTERFLPWDWSGASSEWFCNTGSRAGRGWVPITADMRLADCGDWPPVRALGTVDRFANCQECHGSQIRTRLDAGAGFSTEYTTLQINCESCHGPARRHVELARGSALGSSDDVGLPSLAYLDKDSSLETCFQCHALKDVLKEGYLTGEPLAAYYALKFPVLGDRPYFADARVRTFAYQGTHLASACYLQAPMDCVSCHEPHGQGYWDVNKQPLDGPLDDGQCTACHASKAVDLEGHTFHPADSEGSRCVSCHMPYLQHPDVGADGVHFARSDHTIPVPRPAFDADLGIEGACAKCHTDRSARELQAEARAWWGELKPHRPLVSGIVGELRARNRDEAAELLLRPEETDPLVQFIALSRLLEAYLRPDDATLSPDIEADLLALSRNADLDVRALALASLHYARGDSPEVRRSLISALEGAGGAHADEALRARWALALGYMGDRARDRSDFAVASAAYGKALELRPDDARVLQALGQMHNRAGAYVEAITSFRRSLEVDAAQPLTWVNLGIALSASGDPAGARGAYEEALRLNPHEALAYFNLGNLHRRADRLTDAAAAYARAVAASPGLGQAHFELARTYILLERPADALPHARRAVEFLPDDASSRAMLADLERAVGA